MNEEYIYDSDEVDDEDFIITNLGSVHDLDRAFRPDEQYLARGPFKVHSPEVASWKWGYRLEQVGHHLVFQDGSELGRMVMSDGMSMRASDDGSIIWFFGFEDDGLTVLTLSTATIEDYRASAPKDVAISTFEDGARVVMAELEAKRRAQFGLEFDSVLTSRFGMVFQDCGADPLVGLFFFDHFGGIHSRIDGKWEKCYFPEPGPESDDREDLLLAPILKSGIAAFDALSPDEGAVALDRLNPFLYPKFDIDDPDYWSEMFDDWEIVD